MKPSLGAFTDDSKSAVIDLPRLLLTRMLIQANSGGGKSRALRRLLEVTAGRVQQLIIDPEGEFASLREKHDLVICAAQGGDALAHPRTASLLARRLLETQASAVLDISDLKADQRHAFVRIFLEALVEAPKSLRHPVLVALDEAQIFAPEKGQGESEASAAVIDVATRGRKRGLCLVAATQRISMFHKGVAAELKNRLIGGTSLDVDVKRAAFDLGLPPKEALDKLRALEPGHFFAFGPALHQLQPREIITGDVETTHPEVGHRQSLTPPKPTAAILALLPQLADLPKEAEAEARSIEDLKRELATTRRELSVSKKAQPAAPVDRGAPAELRHAKASIRRLQSAIGDLMKFVVQINATGFAKEAGVDPEALKKAIDSAVGQAMRLVDQKLEAREKSLQALQREGGRLVANIQKLLAADGAVTVAVDVKHQEPFAVTPAPSKSVAKRLATMTAPPLISGSDSYQGGQVSGVQQRILNALAELEQMNAEQPPREMVALLADYKHVRSTGFVKAMSSLSMAGLISYPSSAEVSLTDAGRQIAQAPNRPRTPEEVQGRIIAMLGGASSRILKPLIDVYPKSMNREDVARAAGYEHVRSTGFVKAMSQLSTLGFINYPDRGSIAAKSVLFLE